MTCACLDFAATSCPDGAILHSRTGFVKGLMYNVQVEGEVVDRPDDVARAFPPSTGTQRRSDKLLVNEGSNGD